jgi:hypothetical protein
MLGTMFIKKNSDPLQATLFGSSRNKTYIFCTSFQEILGAERNVRDIS